MHCYLTSSGLSGSCFPLEAAKFPFFLNPLEGTEVSVFITVSQHHNDTNKPFVPITTINHDTNRPHPQKYCGSGLFAYGSLVFPGTLQFTPPLQLYALVQSR